MKLFISAMLEESLPIIDFFQLAPEPGHPFEIYLNAEKKVVLVLSNIGKINAAAATSYGIIKFEPNIIYNIGFAGSINPQMHYGNIIAVTKVYQHDTYLPFTGERFEYFSQPIDIATDTSRYKQGILATGDSFIDNEEAKNEIAQFAQLVDMEGHAVARVGYLHDVPVHIYKIISDNASESAHDDFFETLDQMSHHQISGLINNLFKHS